MVWLLTNNTRCKTTEEKYVVGANKKKEEKKNVGRRNSEGNECIHKDDSN